MIHLPTVAGGQVRHLVRMGAAVRRGALLARVEPSDGPVEEITAPIDGIIEIQRHQNRLAARYASIIGLRRVILADCEGRVQWIATLGPVGTTTMVVLIEHADGVRPHRVGGVGFVGQRYVSPGQRVVVDQPLLEIRGEELA